MPETDLYPWFRRRRDDAVYLVGKVRSTKWELVKKGHFSEAFTFVSSDGNSHSEHLWGGSFKEGNGFDDSSGYEKEQVSERVLSQIQDCDFVVAYLDTPDAYGSIAEIAYASSIGKRVLVLICAEHAYAYVSTPETFEHYAKMFDAYWFVCAFPGVKAIQVEDIQHAREVLRTAFHLMT